MLLGKALLAAAEPSFRAATTVSNQRKAAQWNVFPAEQVNGSSVLSKVHDRYPERRHTGAYNIVNPSLRLLHARYNLTHVQAQDTPGLCRACVEALTERRQRLRLLAASPPWKSFRAQAPVARSSTRWMHPCWR